MSHEPLWQPLARFSFSPSSSSHSLLHLSSLFQFKSSSTSQSSSAFFSSLSLLFLVLLHPSSWKPPRKPPGQDSAQLQPSRPLSLPFRSLSRAEADFISDSANPAPKITAADPAIHLHFEPVQLRAIRFALFPSFPTTPTPSLLYAACPSPPLPCLFPFPFSPSPTALCLSYDILLLFTPMSFTLLNSPFSNVPFPFPPLPLSPSSSPSSSSSSGSSFCEYIPLLISDGHAC